MIYSLNSQIKNPPLL